MRFSIALAEQVSRIGGQVTIPIHLARRPGHLDVFDAIGRPQAEVERGSEAD